MSNDFISEYEWMRIFSGNLRSIMEEEGMTQKELAELTGLSESMISSYINCRRVPNVFSLNNIIHAFHGEYEEKELLQDLVYFDDLVK